MTNGDSVITISKFIDDHVRFFFLKLERDLYRLTEELILIILI